MADGDRWAVSPVGGGLIIELDGQVVSMATDQRHARYLVACVNAWERSAGTGPTCPVCRRAGSHAEGCDYHETRAVGDQLDAERRGHVPVCLTCGHKHFDDAAHADHVWRDSCPYVGTNCGETGEAR